MRRSRQPKHLTLTTTKNQTALHWSAFILLTLALQLVTFSLHGNTAENEITFTDCSGVSSSISGFIYMGEHNGSKYFCSENNKSWSQAISLVAANGGHIAVVDNAAENAYLASNIMASQAWIGYSDASDEGNFSWYNGDNSTYTNWKSSEPNDEDPNYSGADYTVISKGDGYWYDRSGSNSYEVVMEIPCGSTTPTVCTPTEIVKYDMDACTSFSSNGTNYDYSEFTPDYPNNGGFSNVSATNVFRNSGAHSCIDGQGGSGKATCFGVNGLTSFADNSNKAIRFEITLNPSEYGQLTGLKFHEMALGTYDHISGNSGDNDYPTKYGIRVTKNGSEIYKEIDILTNVGSWELQSFDFSNDSDFTITTTTTFKFELLSYDAVDNNGDISAWDLDNIIIEGAACTTPTTGTIGDFVFEDKNGNGIQDNGEAGIDGVSVMLLDDNGNMIGSAQTTTNGGAYLFTGLDADDYKVKFTAPTGYTFTKANEGSDDAKDSDAVVMTGTSDAMSSVFSLGEGEDITNVDAGLYLPAKLGNYVWEDANLDGIQGDFENGIVGIPVELRDADGNNIDNTNTGTNGFYEFTNLAPGSYKVIFPTQATVSGNDIVLTKANEGSDDAKDSDAVAMAIVNEAMSQVVTLESGDNDDTIDAGYFESATLGNKAFIDNNQNGLQDNTDSPLPGVTVMLTGTDVFGNSVSLSQDTDGDGEYLFTMLVPGNYIVMFSQPATYVVTNKDQFANGFDAADSDIDPTTGKTETITLASGDDNQTIDGGFFIDPALPVALTSFEAQLINNNEVVLKWATASEEDNSHFIVERSVDGREYQAIGQVAGNGTTNQINTYSLVDTDPYYGYNYYRLKQVDFDGDYEFSHIETVILSSQDIPDVIIYPNPVVKTTTLRVVTPFETDANIEIVDQAGKVLMTVLMNQGANSKQLNLSEFAPGIYFAYVQYNGHRKLVHRIIKVEE